MNFTFTTAALLLLLATCARGFHFHTIARSRVGQSSTRAVQRPSGSLDGYLMRPANVQPSFTRRNRPLFSSLGSGAVLEKPKISTKKTTENSAKDSAGEWQVRLYNDPVNKREFVARCLMEVCGVNDGAAFQIMMNAHQNGAAVIGRYDFERAELYYTSLRDNGLTVDMVKVGDSD